MASFLPCRGFIILGVVLAAATVARAEPDFSDAVAPASWADALTPESLPPLKYPAFDDDLDKAKAQTFAGRYKLALQTLRTAKSKTPGDVAHANAQCLLALGRFDEALAETQTSDSASLQLDHADALVRLGRTGDALGVVKILVRAHPDSIAGHLRLAQLLESTGDVEQAKLAYGWFVQPPHDFLDLWRGGRFERFTDAADTTDVGIALDRWATLDGQYPRDPGLHETILNLFVKVYDEIDRGYWPAHLAAAEFYRGHDDEEHAKKELQAALSVNPRSTAALRLAGLMAVDDYDFDRADAVVAALHAVDAQSIDADLIETRNLLRQREPKEAGERAKYVLASRPNDLEAMSLHAAAEALQLHDGATQTLLSDIDRACPHQASAYFEVAEQLAAMRQYPRSAAMYKIAIGRAPWWTNPRNGLGLLYTQSGDEDAARATLDAAHTLDPFNVDTTNYLRLLDELAAFAKVETPHFIVRYDAALDPLIPEYYPDYLESIYPVVTGEYRTEPAEKTIIEVFPTHDAFSVRTSGSPWIGTVGASTGRIIAMVAPRKGENTQGAFNWSQVLRHEFTHTVTLAATDNRISHWMTEGLAVMEERSPLQWAWVPMLYQAVSKHQLFDMNRLTWAFIRPKKPADRQLAYAESFWVCTYIRERFGFDHILRMLADFKAGGLQQDVFPRVLGITEYEFFADFQKWCEAKTAGWGYGKDDQAKYDALHEQGERLVQEKNFADAVPVWEQLAALRPVDELPQQRLAGLYSSPAVNEPLKAIDHLKILHQVDLKDDRFAKRISRIYRDAGNLPSARDWALQAIYIDPYDAASHTLMLDICGKMDDSTGTAREKRVIAELTAWKAQMTQ